MTHVCRTGSPLYLSKHTSCETLLNTNVLAFMVNRMTKWHRVEKVWSVWPMCVGLTYPSLPTSLLEQTHLSGGTQVSLHHTYISTVISYMRQPYSYMRLASLHPVNLRKIWPPEIFNKESIQESSGQLSGGCLSKHVFRFQSWPVWLWFCPSGHSEKSCYEDTQSPV